MSARDECPVCGQRHRPSCRDLDTYYDSMSRDLPDDVAEDVRWLSIGPMTDDGLPAIDIFLAAARAEIDTLEAMWALPAKEMQW